MGVEEKRRIDDLQGVEKHMTNGRAGGHGDNGYVSWSPAGRLLITKVPYVPYPSDTESGLVQSTCNAVQLSPISDQRGSHGTYEEQSAEIMIHHITSSIFGTGCVVIASWRVGYGF
nr:hypothetical protein CFP56_53632 [Quercus suber]